ncbi:uncharacterized protein LOC131219110 [Magnolia sinica]|uniref:uncharacterized protein LOC131219110 n=1 Tax=Magnolia sinica TaxID=86752 RepID=UPI00265AABF3|nr:uncharacterized protein LOC131219110 [Magnolia sinica]
MPDDINFGPSAYTVLTLFSGTNWAYQRIPLPFVQAFRRELCSIDVAHLHGYFLVFRYDGQSHFNVEVFDKSGCEKKYECADEGFDSSDSSKDSLEIFPRKISLEVSDGRRWSLSLMFKRCGAELGKGWKDFTLENNLEEDDTWAFELFEREKKLFKVHIFRVIQQVVPLTKVPRRKPTKQTPR